LYIEKINSGTYNIKVNMRSIKCFEILSGAYFSKLEFFTQNLISTKGNPVLFFMWKMKKT